MDFAGFSMPSWYSSVEREVAAVRQGAGLFDVSHMGFLGIGGDGAAALVDHLMTNDFGRAPAGRAVYSPLCDEEGGTIDDAIAYKFSDEAVMMCVNAANRGKVLDWVRRWAHDGRFDAEVSDRSDGTSILALQGPRAMDVFKKTVTQIGGDLPRFGVRELPVGAHALTAARTGYTGEDGVEFFVPDAAAGDLWDGLAKADAVPCGLVARDVLRIEACLPLHGAELAEDRTPLESGLAWAVKLGKSDFVGKSSLERRRPRHRLVRLSLPGGVPRAGFPVVGPGGAEAGRVTSGTWSPTLGRGVALALVGRGAPEGGPFSIVVRGRALEAKLHKGPFVTGGGRRRTT